MYRLIVSDYDGTLVPSGKVLSNKFFTKLNMITSRGCVFAISSGRPYNQLKKLMYQVSNEIVFISDDGAQMMYHNCVLYKKTVDVASARYISKEALFFGMTPIVALREENRKVTKEKLELPFFFSADIFKIIVVKNGKNGDSLKAKCENLKLRVCYEDETYIEFCHKDANKGEAVKKLMEKFSVTPNQTVIFGDGINDIPMLKLAEKRVVSENAEAQVIAVSTETSEDIEKYIIDM